MKKLVGILLISLTVLIFTGCGKAEGYKEGVYEGTALDDYGNQENEASAKVTIDSEGKITAVYLDTTYTTRDGVKTTKKALKEDYGMKKYGDAELEWYEQVEALEKAVVEKQGIDFLNLDEDGRTDAVSGCTIQVGALTKALGNALNKAKN